MLVSRPTIKLCSLFQVRHVMIVLCNHARVVGLFSELLMKLFYCIHLGFGKSFRRTWESNPGPSDPWPKRQLIDQNCYKGKWAFVWLGKFYNQNLGKVVNRYYFFNNEIRPQLHAMYLLSAFFPLYKAR